MFGFAGYFTNQRLGFLCLPTKVQQYIYSYVQFFYHVCTVGAFQFSGVVHFLTLTNETCSLLSKQDKYQFFFFLKTRSSSLFLLYNVTFIYSVIITHSPYCSLKTCCSLVIIYFSVFSCFLWSLISL